MILLLKVFSGSIFFIAGFQTVRDTYRTFHNLICNV
nr:MAG TPA: hypothetical protein [Caudoviricetes sp.]